MSLQANGIVVFCQLACGSLASVEKTGFLDIIAELSFDNTTSEYQSILICRILNWNSQRNVFSTKNAKCFLIVSTPLSVKEWARESQFLRGCGKYYPKKRNYLKNILFTYLLIKNGTLDFANKIKTIDPIGLIFFRDSYLSNAPCIL